MIQPANVPGTPETPLNIQKRMDAFFGIVEICRQVAISAMVSQGMRPEEAEAEWRRLRHDAFLKRERPPFSRRFPKAGIWKSTGASRVGIAEAFRPDVLRPCGSVC